MWTLTYTSTEDNSLGEYLICVFENKPSISDLLSLSMGPLKFCSDEANSLFNVGNSTSPYVNYYLREVTSGQINHSILANGGV